MSFFHVGHDTIEHTQNLPDRIRRYLNDRGINDLVLDWFSIGWDQKGKWITIPLYNRYLKFQFYKRRKDPNEHSHRPKWSVYPPGVGTELYGWEHLINPPESLVICEGEFDRLLLESQGIPAITSTSGAGSFKKEWALYFNQIPHIFVCFDNDTAGRRGAERVTQRLPRAKVISLPEEVGEAGDVTDFFVKLRGSKKEFLELFQTAKRPEVRAEPEPPANLPIEPQGYRKDVEAIKRRIPIEKVVADYVELRRVGRNFVGLCPFLLHKERNPSFTVYPETRSYYCFGCQKHGDVISFLMETNNGLTFMDVIERLVKEYGN